VPRPEVVVAPAVGRAAPCGRQRATAAQAVNPVASRVSLTNPAMSVGARLAILWAFLFDLSAILKMAVAINGDNWIRSIFGRTEFDSVQN
jgi:hypothetical protein